MYDTIYEISLRNIITAKHTKVLYTKVSAYMFVSHINCLRDLNFVIGLNK